MKIVFKRSVKPSPRMPSLYHLFGLIFTSFGDLVQFHEKASFCLATGSFLWIKHCGSVLQVRPGSGVVFKMVVEFIARLKTNFEWLGCWEILKLRWVVNLYLCFKWLRWKWYIFLKPSSPLTCMVAYGCLVLSSIIVPHTMPWFLMLILFFRLSLLLRLFSKMQKMNNLLNSNPLKLDRWYVRRY